MDHDYQKIDLERNYNWRDERIETAKKLGYQYISESIVETYRKVRSSRKAGQILGGFTSQALLRFLHSIGEPTLPPGGWHK